MLSHHDARPYAEAASEAAAQARVKLEGLIEKGRTRALAVIEQVERDIPKDSIVPARALNFAQHGGPDDRILLGWNGEPAVGLHDHALSQAAERAGVPWTFVERLRGHGNWGHGLLAHNLNEIHRRADSRFLIRTVDGEARGFLSDKFRRLDNRPILDAFCKAAAEVGAVPVEGYAMDTKVAVKALLPRVFEPVPNEVMAFGLKFDNSDFGDGALSLRVFMLRLWCTNYAITDEALRQVHLGGKLPDDVVFSDRTYRLDSDRSASMVRDIVATELSPERVEEVCEVIRKANAEGVTVSRVAEFLKRHVTKSEGASIVEAYNSADVVNLPAGNTSWRFSNAISWIAGKTEKEGRKLDLMQIAALALPGGGVLHAERN